MAFAIMFLTVATGIAIAILMHAGKLLRQWRDARGLNQSDAADALGLSQAALSDYENGRKSPSVDRALRIAELTEGAVPVESWRKPDESGEHGAAAADGTHG